MPRGTPPQGQLRDHDHSRPGEGGDRLDIGEITADDVNLEDGDTLDFGTDDDLSWRFNPNHGANGAMIARDEANNTDLLAVPVGAAMELLNRALNVNSQDLEDGGTTLYDAAQGLFLNAVVEALANFAGGDQFGGYPITTTADTDHMAAQHEDGGALEMVVESMATQSMDTSVFFQPDGAGGVQTAAAGGAASSFYGDGSDGAITRSADANENGLILATTYEIDQGVTMTVSEGVLLVCATESITIRGVIDANETGGNGGGGGSGAGTDNDGGNGGDGVFAPLNQTGGAGGGQVSGGTAAGQGGAGGDGDTGSPLQSRLVRLDPTIADRINDVASQGAGAGGGGGGEGSGGDNIDDDGVDGGTPGGGGGGSRDQSGSGGQANGGAGGAGGGVILLIAPDVTIENTATLQADGGDGSNGVSDGANGGGGGAGSGGMVGLIGEAITQNGTLSVAAGVGGTGASTASSSGGDGANGAQGITFQELL